jgi:hypothetical protein
MPSAWIVVFAAVPLLAAYPRHALAQVPPSPGIGILRHSAPNTAGWHNTAVYLEYLCNEGVSCPPETVVDAEGIRQLEHPLLDWPIASEAYNLKIDRTAPSVRLSLPPSSETPAAAVDVVAEVADTLSGVDRAACNGIDAPIAADGRVRCRVTLLPGINDIVVEASDAAGNSGSAGARVRRTGPARMIRILPETIGVVVGETVRLQVLDDFHRQRTDIEWFVDRTDVAALSDGATVRALTPGTMAITATVDGLRATATVNVFEGPTPPVGTVIYKAGTFSLVQTPPVPQYTGPKHGPMASAESAPGARQTLWVQTEGTGLVEWIEVPAVNDDDVARRLYRHGPGGVVLVLEGPDSTGWSLVRGGPSSGVRPWRYRSSGQLSPELVVDAGGTIIAIETPESGFPQLVVFDTDGRVVRREPLPVGLRTERDVDCVPGRGRLEREPAQIGPPKVHPGGSLTFEYTIGHDTFDGCRGGTLVEQQRRLLLMHVRGSDVATHLLREYDAPPDAALPAAELLPVLLGRDGAFLAPWRLAADTGTPTKSRVTRVEPDGLTEEFELPAVGVLVPGLDDLIATTDGTTMVIFQARTGKLRWTHRPPGGDVAILEVRGNVLLSREGKNTTARVMDGSRPALPGVDPPRP